MILGDVDASFFTDDELRLLEELIRDRGASLLMLCGPMYSPGSYTGTPVQAMLPVRFDTEAGWEKIAESVYPVLTREGRSSLVMTLENEVELNDRIWSRMAPMDQLPPLLSAKPGATVLAVPGLPVGRLAALRDGQVHVDRFGPAVAPALQDRRQIPLARLVAMHPVHDALAADG